MLNVAVAFPGELLLASSLLSPVFLIAGVTLLGIEAQAYYSSMGLDFDEAIANIHAVLASHRHFVTVEEIEDIADLMLDSDDHWGEGVVWADINARDPEWQWMFSPEELRNWFAPEELRPFAHHSGSGWLRKLLTVTIISHEERLIRAGFYLSIAIAPQLIYPRLSLVTVGYITVLSFAIGWVNSWFFAEDKTYRRLNTAQHT